MNTRISKLYETCEIVFAILIVTFYRDFPLIFSSIFKSLQILFFVFNFALIYHAVSPIFVINWFTLLWFMFDYLYEILYIL